MKVLRKRGDTVDVLVLPGDLEIERGDFILVSENSKAMLLQVIDAEYADLPGVLEDLLRELSLESIKQSRVFDPFNISSLTMLIRDSRVITTKLRAILADGDFKGNSVWIPSRFSSKISKIDTKTLLKSVVGEPEFPIVLGRSGDSEVAVDAGKLDGSLTIITGKKGSGKSHTAKLLSAELALNGAYVVVLDVNGEYVNLDKSRRGGASAVSDKFLVLEPCVNFRVGINQIDLKTLVDILDHVYSTPSASIREFTRIWNKLKQRGELRTSSLLNAIQSYPMNESIRDALFSRISSLMGSGFFTDEEGEALDRLFAENDDGLLLVIKLDKLAPHLRRVVVEYMLSLLSSLLLSRLIPPVFLVAEEAHLYLRETYWEDLATRMRHIGISPILVTNQPDSIPETIYRQADNVFLFNFTNESDLEAIASYSHVDAETVKRIAPNLPPGHVLVLGKIVGNLPIVVKIRDTDMQMRGFTRLFFKSKRKRGEDEERWVRRGDVSTLSWLGA